MGEKRFILDELYCYVIQDNKKRLTDKQVVDLLNEQQATNDYVEESNSRLQVQLGETLRLVDKLKEENEQLRQQLKEKEEDERLYANEILELRETNKEHIKFKSLGGNY